MADDRLFLVMRDVSGRFSSVLTFDQDRSDVALNVYVEAEARGIDCVLLSADRLSTLVKTHGAWFDEPDLLDPLALGFEGGA